MESTKSRGRPRKAPQERRTVQINFKVTEANFDRIYQASGRYPVASWVRALILDALDTTGEV